MSRSPSFVSAAVLALLLAAVAHAPAGAASSAASSASDSVSDSIGASSKSISGSSDSSSGGHKAAAGDYKVIEMAAVPGQPGQMRLQLQAVAEGGQGFFLTLPKVAVENGHVERGQVVTANARPYGLEFAAADTKKAFFLVIDDEWQGELESHPVSL